MDIVVVRLTIDAKYTHSSYYMIQRYSCTDLFLIIIISLIYSSSGNNECRYITFCRKNLTEKYCREQNGPIPMTSSGRIQASSKQ